MDGNYLGAEHTYIVATLENIKEPIITERYTLPDHVRNELLSTPTPFTSAYTECVFLRTYSRKKDDGTKETWAETVIRVVEGTIEAYLTHYKRNGLTVDYNWLSEFASDMARSFFQRQWSPPGRGLYAMGTDHTRKNGNAALNNCYACETKNLVLAASWAMDQLMCGGGVGFDCSWDGIATTPNKQDSFTFSIPDTRQGWVAAIELLLRAYIPVNGQITNKFPKMDYSLIRAYGEPIHGFGGTASGPDPLKVLLARLEIFLDTYITWQNVSIKLKRCGDTQCEECESCKKDIFLVMAQRLHDVESTYGNFDKDLEELKTALDKYDKTYDKTRLVADVFNAIGACVVAGNIRRCLPGDALVHTSKGLKPITDVKVGDEVLTYDGYYPVTEHIRQGKQELVKIITQDGEFRCTVNHKMAVRADTSSKDYTWVEAFWLQPGDRLVSIRNVVEEGNPYPSEVIAIVPDIIEETYDISVKDRHEFFCNGYLTHNSAQIAIGDAGDETFLELKNDKINPERRCISWMSNNTVRFEKHEDFEKYIPEVATRIQKNGEPGFFNVINARKFGRYTEVNYGEDTGRLLNPCVTGDTLVMTDEGMQRVDQLIGKQFNAIVDGRAYPSTKEGFWKTGDKECFLITLKNGMKVEATENHKFLAKKGKTFHWTEVKDFKVGNTLALSDNTGYSWEGGQGSWEEGYFCGQLVGDGTFDGYTPLVALWIPNDVDIEDHPSAQILLNLAKSLDHRSDFEGWRVEKETEKYTKYTMQLASFQRISDKFGIFAREKKVPETNLSYDFTRGFLSGFFDADGSVQGSVIKSSFGIRLAQSNLERLEAVQRLLASIGINSTIYKERRKAGGRMLPNGKGGLSEYQCKADHEVIISRKDIERFRDIVGFVEENKQEKLIYNLGLYKKGPRPSVWESPIVSIVPTGIKTVYDCTIDEIHSFSAGGIVGHNCAEIVLNSFEPCTLSTICPSNCKGPDGKIQMSLVMEAARYATFYATTVTCVKHHWGVSNAVIAHNRRIGVSLTGISNIYEEYGFTYLTTLCRKLYHEIRSYNADLAAKAGIPRAIRVTTVKPEGTLSIIMEVNAGVHFPICRFARRRIGIAKNDDLLGPLITAGYPIEESTYSNSMVYVIFPLKFGECRSEREVSIYEQFGLVSSLQRSYSDNSVSFTGHFSIERESDDVERVIAMFAPQIKACSMLPYSDDLSKAPAYKHMPFEEISEEEYLALKATIKPVVWSHAKGEDVVAERGCTNDSCSL